MPINTPVVLIIFNRPETTARVFAEIARIQPRTLFIVADGPRPDYPNEVEQVEQTRAIVEQINWDCEAKYNYADANLGLKTRVSSGLNWVFSQVEEAIILEDDCLPDPTFFPYCETLLTYYRDNDRILHISGSNLLLGAHSVENSYYFTRYPHVWGWATWRRAWTLYDIRMTRWLEDSTPFLSQFEDTQEREFWRKVWDDVSSGQVDSWAYPWVFTCQAHNGLCINPATNLISNIGFGPDATHTKDIDGIGSKIPLEAMKFPLRHPDVIERDPEAEQVIAERFFQRRNPWQIQLEELTNRLKSSEAERAAQVEVIKALRSQIDELRQQSENMRMLREAEREQAARNLNELSRQLEAYEQLLEQIRSRKINRIMKRLGKPII